MKSEVDPKKMLHLLQGRQQYATSLEAFVSREWAAWPDVRITTCAFLTLIQNEMGWPLPFFAPNDSCREVFNDDDNYGYGTTDFLLACARLGLTVSDDTMVSLKFGNGTLWDLVSAMACPKGDKK